MSGATLHYLSVVVEVVVVVVIVPNGRYQKPAAFVADFLDDVD